MDSQQQVCYCGRGSTVDLALSNPDYLASQLSRVPGYLASLAISRPWLSRVPSYLTSPAISRPRLSRPWLSESYLSVGARGLTNHKTLT